MAETLGSLCDKLTIVKLKQYHCDDSEKAERLGLQEKQLAEAMELLELAKSDIEDLKECEHCKFNLLERCPECDEYGDNWQWQHQDLYEKLKQATDINVGNINEMQMR